MPNRYRPLINFATSKKSEACQIYVCIIVEFIEPSTIPRSCTQRNAKDFIYIYTHMFYKNCNRDWSDNLDLVKHRNLCQINNKIDWRCDNFHENSFETLKIRMKCNTLLHTIFYTY